MHRPSTLRLFGLFARTAARRFCNRFLYAWQKKAEAKRKRRNLPEPARTATAHRQQRFRAGTVLVIFFTAYMVFAIGMMMNQSFVKNLKEVGKARAPAAAAQDGEGPVSIPPPVKVDSNPAAQPKETVVVPQVPSGPRVLRLDPASRLIAEKVTGLMMFVAGAGTLLFAIGMLSRQITRPEPSLAWLFEFPVPRPVLFASRLAEGLFDGASLPLLSLLPGIWFFHSGYGFWASVGWGLAFGALIALSLSALRMAVEVLLLQKCQRRRRGTIGGLSAALGALLMVMVVYGGNAPAMMSILLAAADALPDWLYHNPFSAGHGAGLTFSSASWFTAAGISAALCVGSVLLCSRLTKYGLEPGLETVRGSRDAAKVSRARYTGLVGKELLMLVRQRIVMVQVVLAPLIMMVMMYFQSGGRLAERILGSGAALASAVYGICAYMVLIASQVAMNMELRTLWLLLSLPRPLADSLRMKSRIWGIAAASLALVLSLGAVAAHHDLAGGLFYRLPFILAFVGLVADLSVGIRTMGSSIVSETTVHFRQWAAWLPLALSAAAGQAVFSGDLWILFMQLVLLGALDVGVWQKLNAELPWLTEPAEDPPPRLFLMHGQLAAYGYAALQSLLIFIPLSAGVPVGVSLLVSGAVAAVIVALLADILLSRRGVRILPGARASQIFSFALAAAGLAVACTAGYFWLEALQSWSWASGMLEESRKAFATEDNSTRFGLVALAVFVAPMCEEFIFRGLVYQGLRRVTGAGWSILWSSLFFMVIHPQASSVAVFVLAAVNAFIMERTGRLLPCILVHAGYNAFVVWLQWPH